MFCLKARGYQQPWIQSLENLFSLALPAGSRKRRRRNGFQSGELLECREVLSAVPWDRPAELTASIAPDGTDISGQSSQFFQTFSDLGTPTQLRQTIAEVFQTWTQYANINIGYVSDGGQAFGSAGKTQGDHRFGDIRIGAVSMSSEVYAFSVPHSGGIAGTWTGDIVFNSNFRPASLQQLKAVAMHEVGHVLGLVHNPDPASPMHLHNSVSTSANPAPSDITALQKLHGVRVDAAEIKRSNNNPGNAISARDGSFDGQVPLLNYGEIAGVSDADYYRIDPIDSYSGTVTIQLRIHGLSMLRGQLQIVNRSGKVLAVAQSSSYGTDAVVHLEQTGNDKLYARVSAIGGGQFSFGRYALVTVFDGLNRASAELIESVPAANVGFLDGEKIRQLFLTGLAPEYYNDLHLDDTLATAQVLKTEPGFTEGTAYRFEATISDSADVDYYEVKGPKTVRANEVLTVTVDAPLDMTLIPAITIYDKNGVSMPFTVLRNGNGTISVQVRNISASDIYKIRVQSDDKAVRYRQGNYTLNVRFGAFAEEHVDLLTGEFTSENSLALQELDLKQTRLLALGLTTTGISAGGPAVATQLTLFDESGNEVYRMVNVGNVTRTSNSIILKPGRYFVRINAVSQDGTPVSNAKFELNASVLSDDTGPLGANPLDMPAIDADLIDVVTIGAPTLPPPAFSEPLLGEDPWIFVPDSFVDFEDWYWFYSSNI